MSECHLQNFNCIFIFFLLSVLQECQTDSEELIYQARAPSSCSAPPDLLITSDPDSKIMKNHGRKSPNNTKNHHHHKPSSPDKSTYRKETNSEDRVRLEVSI